MSTTIKELIANYELPKNYYIKDSSIKKFSSQKNNPNISQPSQNEDPSYRSKRNPRCFNVTKSNANPNLEKSHNCNSRSKKNQINKNYFFNIIYNPGNNNSKGLNKTVYHDTLVLSKHERNFSVPSLKSKKKQIGHSIAKKNNKNKKHNIIKIKQEKNFNMNRTLNDINDEREYNSVKNNSYLLTNDDFENYSRNPNKKFKTREDEEINNKEDIIENNFSIKSNSNNNYNSELTKKTEKKMSKIRKEDIHNKEKQKIKNAEENISILKKQLKEDNIKNKNQKTKLEKSTFNTLNSTSTNNNNINQYHQINIKSNFHNYNMNTNKYTSKKNDRVTPNKTSSCTSERGNTSNANHTTISNNKNNYNKNNNNFGKKINLSNIYGKHNETLDNIYSDRSNKYIKKYHDEDNAFDSSIDNYNNIPRKNNFDIKKNNYVSLQKNSNDINNLWKTTNQFSLSNNYNNFNRNQKRPNKKEKERPFNHSIAKKPKNKKNNNEKSDSNNLSSISYRYNTFTDEKNMSKANEKKIVKNDEEKLEKNIVKRNSCNPKIRNKSSDKRNNSSITTNKVKKFFTKNEIKTKSISKISAVCIAGEVVFGEPKTNQDNYFNTTLSNNLKFIGVCDGHGDNGHYVSEYLIKNLPLDLEKNICQLSDASIFDSEKNLKKVEKLFINSFEQTDKKLSQYANNSSKFDVEYSGSTCVSLLFKNSNINNIYIANVGDSRAIMIKETNNKYWTCQQLSRDHKPTEKDEAQRILDYDGEIEKIEDDDGNWTGPLRVWVKGSDGPGLAMTRSFGDEVGTSVGVLPLPEVTEYKVKEEDRMIVIASDGLWEYVSNKEVTDVCKKFIGDGVEKVCNMLYDLSVKRWREKDQGIDDITIVCVLLKSG